MALLTGEEILAIAMRLEESGESFYKRAAHGATSASVRALFEELAVQEQYHRRAFQQMSSSAVADTLSPEQWDQFQSYAAALLQQRFFSDPQHALSAATDAEDEQEALDAALGFERETIAFYEQLHGVVRHTEQGVIQRIIDEERHHIQRLSAMQAAQQAPR